MEVSKGRIVEWNTERGFGWAQVGGTRVFCHIRDFADRRKLPSVGDDLRFHLGTDAKGRVCAKRITGVRSAPGLGWFDGVILAALLLLPGIAVVSGDFERGKVAAFFIVISSATYFTYAYDKHLARTHGFRVAELRLHALEAIGGWPGAFLAQRQFRHKCSKLRYQLVFWAIVLVWQFVAFESLNDWRMVHSIWRR